MGGSFRSCAERQPRKFWKEIHRMLGEIQCLWKCPAPAQTVPLPWMPSEDLALTGTPGTVSHALATSGHRSEGPHQCPLGVSSVSR